LGTRASKISLVAVALEQPQLNPEGCVLIEFLEPGKTIHAAHYVQTLLKLFRALRDERPGRKVNTTTLDLTLTVRLTLEKIEDMGWEVLLILRTVLIWHPPIIISLVL
jgi:hypothetical protein